MTFLLNCLCVGAGGFVGSILRYGLGYLAPTGEGEFPFITLFINVAGSFALAFISTFAYELDIDHQLLLFLRVGLCGGFTTFSTFTFESMEMLQRGDFALAALYMVGSCLVCLLFAFLGQIAGIQVSPR